MPENSETSKPARETADGPFAYYWHVYDARVACDVATGVEDDVEAAKAAAMSVYTREFGFVGERVDIGVDTEDGYWQAGRQNETWDKEKGEYRKDFFRWKFHKCGAS